MKFPEITCYRIEGKHIALKPNHTTPEGTLLILTTKKNTKNPTNRTQKQSEKRTETTFLRNTNHNYETHQYLSPKTGHPAGPDPHPRKRNACDGTGACSFYTANCRRITH